METQRTEPDAASEAEERSQDLVHIRLFFANQSVKPEDLQLLRKVLKHTFASAVIDETHVEAQKRDTDFETRTQPATSQRTGRLGGVPYLLITDHPEALGHWGGREESCTDGAGASLLFVGPEFQRLNQGSSAIDRSPLRGVPHFDVDEIVWCAQSLLFPILQRRLLDRINNERNLRALLLGTERQLSVFYHNISNPLTVLSGNIQFLQLLSNTASFSADIEKSIHDIKDVVQRFEKELQVITALRERLSASTHV